MKVDSLTMMIMYNKSMIMFISIAGLTFHPSDLLRLLLSIQYWGYGKQGFWRCCYLQNGSWSRFQVTSSDKNSRQRIKLQDWGCIRDGQCYSGEKLEGKRWVFPDLHVDLFPYRSSMTSGGSCGFHLTCSKTQSWRPSFLKRAPA